MVIKVVLEFNFIFEASVINLGPKLLECHEIFWVEMTIEVAPAVLARRLIRVKEGKCEFGDMGR